jgi:hypothetical protein
MGVHASFVVIGVLLIVVSLGVLLFVREPVPVIEVLEPAKATGGGGE